MPSLQSLVAEKPVVVHRVFIDISQYRNLMKQCGNGSVGLGLRLPNHEGIDRSLTQPKVSPCVPTLRPVLLGVRQLGRCFQEGWGHLKVTEQLSRAVSLVSVTALPVRWGLWALHSSTRGAWLPSGLCPVLAVSVSLPPWALLWKASLLLQSPKRYFSSFPWPQTSALHPFLLQCPAQCLVPCQKLAWRAFTLAGQQDKQTRLVTPVHTCRCLGLASQHSHRVSQRLPERHASEPLALKSGVGGIIPVDAKVSEEGWTAALLQTPLLPQEDETEKQQGCQHKQVDPDWEFRQGDSVLVRTWGPAWSPARTSRK